MFKHLHSQTGLSGKRWVSTFVYMLILLGVRASFGEPLLVVTEGRSAQRIATGTYLHGVDSDQGLSTEGVLLSDRDWDHALSFSDDGLRAAGVGLIEPNRGAADKSRIGRYLFVLGLAPLNVATPVYSVNEEVVSHFFGYDPERDSSLLYVIYRQNGDGRLSYETGEKSVSIPLAGAPVAALPISAGQSVAIVLQSPESSQFMVQMIELGGRRRIGRAILLPDRPRRFGSTVGAIAESGNGRYLFIGLSGYLVGESEGERSSWVETIDLEESRALGLPLEVKGTLPVDGSGIVAAADDRFWVVSQTSGRSFGYAARGTVVDGMIEGDSALVFTGVRSAIRVGLSRDSGLTAIGVGKNLYVYDRDGSRIHAHRFDDTVGALFWSTNGLVLGVGNRVALVDLESGALNEPITLDTGRVVHIVRHPNSTAFSEANYAVTSPRWIRSIRFREDRFGTEQFAVGPPGTAMKTVHQKDVMLPTWLLLNQSGDEVQGDTLTIDSNRFVRDTGGTDTVLLPMQRASKSSDIDTSRLMFEIDVDPPGMSTPSLLWVRSAEEHQNSVLDAGYNNPFSRIVRRLQQFPFSYIIDDVSSAGELDLRGYTAVVLTSALAEHGILTRQEILDYLSAGGTVLYMAGASSSLEGTSVGRWLEALGMQLDAEAPIDGVFEVESDEGYLRHWKRLPVFGGMGIRVSDRHSILVADSSSEEIGIAVSRTYGLGRVIGFASSTPFENRALANADALRLAEGIFRQLGDASADRSDLDGDGIPDHIEDRNRNGVHDPGETFFANPDSDGDGIFDGLEDQNQNGFVDDIETSPLLADTDQDGIADAADLNPLPPSGAPYIASIEPSSMPAEGSRAVLIQGRNFTANSEIWFGDYASPEIRLLNRGEVEAIVPSKLGDNEEVVDVEIRDENFFVVSKIEDGFRYGRRSSVGLALKVVETIYVQYGIYQYFVHGQLSNGPLEIGQASLILEAEPPEVIEYLGVVPEAAVSGDRQRMRLTVLGKGRVRVELNEPTAFKPGVPLFEVQCRLNFLEADTTEFTLRIVEKELRTPYEGIVKSQNLTDISHDFRKYTRYSMQNE